jgi:hypothetical protein
MPIHPDYYSDLLIEEGKTNDFFGKCNIVADNGTIITANATYNNKPVTYSQCGGNNNGYNADARNEMEKNPSRARHYGFLFNTYVMLQIFNEINARKLLASEVNPFADFFNNKFFLIILIISVIVQIALVQI